MSEKLLNSELKIFYKVVGENVAKYRKEKNISQLELAQALGHKSRTIVSLAELSQNKHFNLEHLYRIAQYLDIDLCKLLLQPTKTNKHTTYS